MLFSSRVIIRFARDGGVAITRIVRIVQELLIKLCCMVKYYDTSSESFLPQCDATWSKEKVVNSAAFGSVHGAEMACSLETISSKYELFFFSLNNRETVLVPVT